MAKNGENFPLDSPSRVCYNKSINEREMIVMNKDLLVPLTACDIDEVYVPASVLVERLNALIAVYGDKNVKIAIRRDYSEVVVFDGEIEVLE
jgi:hypothetical protein